MPGLTQETRPGAVVLLVGPQASGKSTVARALGEELRRRGERVALVELDEIAAMALPTLPDWETATSVFAMVAGAWARADLSCVIAEGIASRDEVSVVLGQLPADAVVVTVVMTTPYAAALPRAQADPTRDASRDPLWLAERYDEWSAELGRISADLRLDASVLSVDGAVEEMITAVAAARSSRG